MGSRDGAREGYPKGTPGGSLRKHARPDWASQALPLRERGGPLTARSYLSTPRSVPGCGGVMCPVRPRASISVPSLSEGVDREFPPESQIPDQVGRAPPPPLGVCAASAFSRTGCDCRSTPGRRKSARITSSRGAVTVQSGAELVTEHGERTPPGRAIAERAHSAKNLPVHTLTR